MPERTARSAVADRGIGISADEILVRKASATVHNTASPDTFGTGLLIR
jgi:hypothetical protein